MLDAAEPAPAPRPLFPDKEVRSVLPESETRKKSSPAKIDRLAPDSPLNGVADLPLFMTPSQQPQQRLPFSREQIEQLDKRKNWMFVDPKSDKDNTADKILGVREEKSPGEEKEEYKDLMQRHLEKGGSKADGRSGSDSDGDAKGRDGEKASTETKTGDSSFFILPGDSARYGLKGDAKGIGTEPRTFGTRPATGTSSLSGGASPVTDTPANGFFAPASSGRPSYLPEGSLAPQKTQSQKEWAAEFKQLLDGKAPSGSAFGSGRDPANVFADPSKQSLNPVIGVRPDSYNKPATPAAPTAFSIPTRPTTFESFNRPPSLSDNGGSIFGAPPASSPGFGSQFTPPSAVSRPGGFQELPKRKF